MISWGQIATIILSGSIFYKQKNFAFGQGNTTEIKDSKEDIDEEEEAMEEANEMIPLLNIKMKST